MGGLISTGACVLQSCTRKTRLLDVVYNSSNNELVSATSKAAGVGSGVKGTNDTSGLKISLGGCCRMSAPVGSMGYFRFASTD